MAGRAATFLQDDLRRKTAELTFRGPGEEEERNVPERREEEQEEKKRRNNGDRRSVTEGFTEKGPASLTSSSPSFCL